MNSGRRTSVFRKMTDSEDDGFSSIKSHKRVSDTTVSCASRRREEEDEEEKEASEERWWSLVPFCLASLWCWLSCSAAFLAMPVGFRKSGPLR